MPTDQRGTILLVTDEPAVLSQLNGLLEPEGFAIRAARDAKDAVKRASSPKIDLLLLDMGLARGSGLEALRQIRGQEEEARRAVKIIAIAREDDRPTRLAALRLGVDDFVTEPFDREELVARIGRSLAAKREMDQLVDESARLKRLSITDGLTRLYNHRFFHDRLGEEFHRADRGRSPLSLILLDLDHFKSVNDRWGHPMGDRVLADVAGCLRRNVRGIDILARYGGEEFGLLLPNTHGAGALLVAERVWRDLGCVRTGPEGALTVTASIGVATFPDPTIVAPEDLFQAADAALYRAKNAGRNKVCHSQRAPTAEVVPATSG